MPIHHLAEMTWPEVEMIPRERTAAILPIGATEAHGPHLPISTDVILSEGMAEAAGEQLSSQGWEVVILPTVAFTAAPFASGFEGTVSVTAETTTMLVRDVVRSLWSQRFWMVALANTHFDPSHLAAVYTAVEALEREAELSTPAKLQVVYPDVTRRHHAERLTEEFQSGACHAGRYEGSLVLARRPDLVRESIQRDLPSVAISLPQAIRKGQATFEEAGGVEAYFGDPAAASAAEGQDTYLKLGELLAEAVVSASDRK